MRHLNVALRATPTNKLFLPTAGLLSTYLLMNPWAEDKSIAVALGYFIAVGLTFYFIAGPMRPIVGGLITDIKEMAARFTK